MTPPPITVTFDALSERPDSPCIGVCALDDHSVCIGCRRTSAEITLWTRLSPAQQWQVVHDLSNRPRED